MICLRVSTMIWRNLRLWLSLLLCAAGAVACRAELPQGGPRTVAATIVPLADWARQVGGDRVEVELIVPPGVDPRGYELSAQQREYIQSADVVLMNGLGVEPWIDPVLDERRSPQVAILEVSQFVGPLAERVPRSVGGVPLEQEGDADFWGRAEDQLVPAPVRSAYLWLDPASAMSQVDLIARTLTRVDPEGVGIYRQNASRYQGELENLDNSIFRQVGSWQSRTLLVEDLFLYPFARHYGLTLYVLGDAKSARLLASNVLVALDRFAADGRMARPALERGPAVVLNPLAGQTYFELIQANAQTLSSVLVDRGLR